MSALAHEPSGSRTLEALLAASAAVWWARVYSVFRGKLSAMAAHPLANFVVQSLISRAPTKRWSRPPLPAARWVAVTDDSGRDAVQ